MKKHLSRLAAPRTWKVKRKGIKWITKAKTGAHSLKMSLPLRIILRDMLNYASTSNEVRKLVNKKEVLIDNIVRTEERFAVGFMDVIELPKLKEAYRVLFDTKGRLTIRKITKDSDLKICKIKNKTIVKGNTQLNLFDGKNILVEKDDYKTGDSVVLDLKSQKVKSHLPLKKGVTVFLIGGGNVGKIAVIEDITEDYIMIKLESDEIFETPKKNVYVVGDKKPAIELS